MSRSEIFTDVLIVGGGLGGVAAALTITRLGNNAVLAEEQDWLGGQLTNQAVPPDENMWIESSHGSPTYRLLRQRIRSYYSRNYPLRSPYLSDPLLNPGLGLVSRLCHEPRVADAAINELLSPHIASGRLRVLRSIRPTSCSVDSDRLQAVTFASTRGADEITISATYVLDATELGDLLEIAQVEHTIGAEGSSKTGELHAIPNADPLCQQAFSWCFALDYCPGESHVIEKPNSYDYWAQEVPEFWPGSRLSWNTINPITLRPHKLPLFGGDMDAPGVKDLWHFRRILARRQFEPGTIDRDITLVNWPQIDYWDRPLLGVSDIDQDKALRESRELSLSFLYWMQTEAPRHDGDDVGYPELRLRPDITDTLDGLAKAPYIRESRRIASEFTILEEHIGVEARDHSSGAQLFEDTVGIGSYRIDLHPSCGGHNYVDIDCYPFQIPLGALIPIRMENLLPANKNIGTTHITNGAYRLHPVEWSIGEAAGALAAFCLAENVSPRRARKEKKYLQRYQLLLSEDLGVTLAWPDHIRHVTPQLLRKVTLDRSCSLNSETH